jgi:hypothetical protein
MDKLTLNVETLRVDSYATAPAAREGECSGTVYTTTATHNTYCNC